MELSIYNTSGKPSGKNIKLDPAVFGIEPNEHAIYLDVKQYLANQRQGTSKVKARAEVAYSTKKIKRQKGTGGARAGSIKSPLFVGGGRVHGPVPRDYGFKLNKKVKRLARRSALSVKAANSNIRILEDFQIETPRTKDYVSMLKGLELDNKKTLLVTQTSDMNVVRSARNFPLTRVVTADTLTTYDIMNANVLILCEGSVQKISETLK